MTTEETLALMADDTFNIEDYVPNETDTPQQVEDKVAVLNAISALKDDPGFNGFAQNIQCMVQCVIDYLACFHNSGLYNGFCQTLLQGCINQCQQ